MIGGTGDCWLFTKVVDKTHGRGGSWAVPGNECSTKTRKAPGLYAIVYYNASTAIKRSLVLRAMPKGSYFLFKVIRGKRWMWRDRNFETPSNPCMHGEGTLVEAEVWMDVKRWWWWWWWPVDERDWSKDNTCRAIGLVGALSIIAYVIHEIVHRSIHFSAMKEHTNFQVNGNISPRKVLQHCDQLLIVHQ